eukprot:scaffold805_cov110-Isochrysis_galbana.AAC.2
MSPASDTWAATRAATFSNSTVTNNTNSSSPSSPDPSMSKRLASLRTCARSGGVTLASMPICRYRLSTAAYTSPALTLPSPEMSASLKALRAIAWMEKDSTCALALARRPLACASICRATVSPLSARDRCERVCSVTATTATKDDVIRKAVWPSCATTDATSSPGEKRILRSLARARRKMGMSSSSSSSSFVFLDEEAWAAAVACRPAVMKLRRKLRRPRTRNGNRTTAIATIMERSMSSPAMSCGAGQVCGSQKLTGGGGGRALRIVADAMLLQILF